MLLYVSYPGSLVDHALLRPVTEFCAPTPRRCLLWLLCRLPFGGWALSSLLPLSIGWGPLAPCTLAATPDSGG